MMFGGRKPSTQSQPSTPAGSTAVTSHPQTQTPAPVPRQPVGFETVFGANAVFKGDLKSKANVRIDGQFEGALEIDGNVFVGETAKVTADIQAKHEIKVSGAVRGNIIGRKVHLSRTGRVWGDITTSALTTEEGAFIEGKITMGNHPASQGFNAALPAPEVSVLYPMHDDSTESEHIEAELVDEEDAHSDKKDESGKA